jgi:hypothetical protein
MTRLRTRGITTKVTEDEYAIFEARAHASGTTVSEWTRDVLGTAVKAAAPPEGPVILAEVLALRSLVLNLFYKLVNGTPVTAGEMQRLIERADAEKAARAQAQLAAPLAGGAR